MTKLDFDDGILFEEVDQRCPLCNTSLFKKLSDRTRYFFSITKIYPEAIPSSREADFDILHPKPTDPEDKINKICLCNSCSANYQFNPTTDDYDKLYRFKQRAIKNNGIASAASTVLDDKIKQILENLKECDTEADSFKKLRMKPLKVVNKIYPENRMLIKAIKDDNDAYYNYIKENLSQMDGYKISFRKITHEVADCFLNLLEVTDDQDEIYNALTQWILDTQMLPESYRNAAHIVISFFVQNCEVFDEITE
ncbi:MAG: ABC-three component system protein [Bacilli bacterium]